MVLPLILGLIAAAAVGFGGGVLATDPDQVVNIPPGATVNIPSPDSPDGSGGSIAAIAVVLALAWAASSK